MMLRGLITALFAIAVSQAAAQNTSLTALDDDYQAIGWEAVGKLDLNGGFCTGTLIAPDLVLSAAHCVYDRRGQLLKPGVITFQAGFRNGQVAATRKVSQVVAHQGFKPREPLTGANVIHDVALLRLEKPIPTHEIDPFVLHGDAVRPGAVSVVSYGQGRANLQSRQRECGLLERLDDLLLFDCDVTFGSSGAPVFSHLNGRGRILSVISGGLRDRTGKQIAVGPHLPKVVSEIKQAMRANQRGPVAKIRRLGVGQSGNTGAKFVKAN